MGQRSVARSSLRALIALALIVTFAAPSDVAGADAALCKVKNATTGAHGKDLQAVIDSASSGNTLFVRGTCAGTFTLSKDLRIRGRMASGLPTPSLDGMWQGSVLTVSSARVVLIDLSITHGHGKEGGGIFNSQGQVILKGSTTVTDNRARFGGGGIFNLSGIVTLTDTASVRGNLSPSQGGGVDTYYGDLFMKGSATIAGNHAQDGGGIFSEGVFYNHGVHMFDHAAVIANEAGDRAGGIWSETSVDMHDASSITGNSADAIGGIYEDSQLVLSGAASVLNNLAYDAPPGGIEITSHGVVLACDSASSSPWTGAIRPNTPDDPSPTPVVIHCT
jgi:hypothetical protein